MPVLERSRVPGLFFALDGPDGGGKTTQAARLVTWLREQGYDVVACRDPGGTAVGERVREILLDRATTHLAMRAEMLLYMACRAQLVEEVIRPALEAGRVVVSDRYLLANVVYQGYAGGLPVDEIWRVGEAATGGLMPDLTLLIDVPPEVAQARVGAPRDRLEDRPEAFRLRVRQGFLEALDHYPAPIALIDGAADEDTVAARLRDEVARALAIRART
jgi:dTMP kinase